MAEENTQSSAEKLKYPENPRDALRQQASDQESMLILERAIKRDQELRAEFMREQEREFIDARDKRRTDLEKLMLDYAEALRKQGVPDSQLVESVMGAFFAESPRELFPEIAEELRQERMNMPLGEELRFFAENAPDAFSEDDPAEREYIVRMDAQFREQKGLPPLSEDIKKLWSDPETRGKILKYGSYGVMGAVLVGSGGAAAPAMLASRAAMRMLPHLSKAIEQTASLAGRSMVRHGIISPKTYAAATEKVLALNNEAKTNKYLKAGKFAMLGAFAIAAGAAGADAAGLFDGLGADSAPTEAGGTDTPEADTTAAEATPEGDQVHLGDNEPAQDSVSPDPQAAAADDPSGNTSEERSGPTSSAPGVADSADAGNGEPSSEEPEAETPEASSAEGGGGETPRATTTGSGWEAPNVLNGESASGWEAPNVLDGGSGSPEGEAGNSEPSSEEQEAGTPESASAEGDGGESPRATTTGSDWEAPNALNGESASGWEAPNVLDGGSGSPSGEAGSNEPSTDTTGSDTAAPAEGEAGESPRETPGGEREAPSALDAETNTAPGGGVGAGEDNNVNAGEDPSTLAEDPTAGASSIPVSDLIQSMREAGIPTTQVEIFYPSGDLSTAELSDIVELSENPAEMMQVLASQGVDITSLDVSAPEAATGSPEEFATTPEPLAPIEVTVEKGDTLSNIIAEQCRDQGIKVDAELLYGNGVEPGLVELITQQNPHIENPDLIYPGQTVTMSLDVLHGEPMMEPSLSAAALESAGDVTDPVGSQPLNADAGSASSPENTNRSAFRGAAPAGAAHDLADGQFDVVDRVNAHLAGYEPQAGVEAGEELANNRPATGDPAAEGVAEQLASGNFDVVDHVRESMAVNQDNTVDPQESSGGWRDRLAGAMDRAKSMMASLTGGGSSGVDMAATEASSSSASEPEAATTEDKSNWEILTEAAEKLKNEWASSQEGPGGSSPESTEPNSPDSNHQPNPEQQAGSQPMYANHNSTKGPGM